jgi:hypothetical protein
MLFAGFQDQYLNFLQFTLWTHSADEGLDAHIVGFQTRQVYFGPNRHR